MKKIVQIAVAEHDKSNDSLYALDSDGVIWAWWPTTNSHNSGWAQIPAPWDNPRTTKSPAK